MTDQLAYQLAKRLTVENQLAEAAPGIGHNEPPLREVIIEALAPFLGRRNDLLQTAETAVIIDDNSAEKVVNLSAMIRALEKDIDTAREEMKRPHLAACRAIDAEFGSAIRPLTICRQGEDGRSGLRGMLTTFEKKREAEAYAHRQAALAEQRRREEEAEALRRAAEEKTAAGKSGIGDELDALAAQEAADDAARRAAAIRPEPVRAQLGSLGSRREIAFDIEDPRKLVNWMLRQPFRGNLDQALRTIMGQYLRTVGVAAVEIGVEIPGLKAWVSTQAQVRR